MADSNIIYISLGNISNRSLNNAKSELEAALGYLRSLDSMDSQQYEDADGEMQFLFDGELASNAHASAVKIEKTLSKLEEYGKLLKSGPEALADVDANSKIPNAILRDIIRRSVDIIGGVTPIEPKVKKIVEIRDYENGVKRGTIRYVCQNKNFDKNGWDLNINTPKEQCNIAVESMGLSYIGIDVAPRDMQNVKGADGKTTYSLDFVKDLSELSNLKDVEGKDCTVTATKLTSYDETKFEKMFKAFDGDATYSTSPVMIRFVRNDGGGHWILITGANYDDKGNIESYNAIGPSDYDYNIKEREPFEITIDEKGNIGLSKNSKNTAVNINGDVKIVAQYTRTDS